MTQPSSEQTASITLNFLYQLIGMKEVERAVLAEQVVLLRGELDEVKRTVAALAAGGVDNADAGPQNDVSAADSAEHAT